MTLASFITNHVTMGTLVIINSLPLLPLGSFIYNHSFEDTLVIKYEYQNYPILYPLFLLATMDHLVISFKHSLNTLIPIHNSHLLMMAF